MLSQMNPLANAMLAGFRSVEIQASTYRIHQDHYEVTQTIAVASLPDALPELVFSMLSPLYELFDFFRFPKRPVDEELTSMRQNTFAH